MRSVLGGMRRIERHVRRNSSLVSDQELQNSFDGFLPRIKSLENLFSNETDRDHLKELIGSSNFKKLPEQLLIGLKVYSDLQSPLLKKYNFDAPDFITGATEAVIQMQKAMASRNLSNYCNGISSDSTSNDLLKESLSPFIYNAAVSAQQTMHENGNSMVMTNIIINRCAIYGIRTKIFEYETLKLRREQIEMQRQIMNSQLKVLKFEQLKKSQTLNNAVSESMDNTTDNTKSFVMPLDSDSVELDEEYVYHEESIIYPDQSVVASVDVVFNSTETYSNTIVDKETGESTYKTPSRTVQSIWTFDACISGQTAMDWHVVDLDGKCGSAHGRFVREPTAHSSMVKGEKIVEEIVQKM